MGPQRARQPGRRRRSLSADGLLLTERHGDDYRALGFAFHTGEYTAQGPEGLGSYGTSDPYPGTLEAALHATGLSGLFLDLRETEPPSDWLSRPLGFRSIGALALDHAFSDQRVPAMFDGLIFLERSTPSRLLTQRRQERGGGGR